MRGNPIASARRESDLLGTGDTEATREDGTEVAARGVIPWQAIVG